MTMTMAFSSGQPLVMVEVIPLITPEPNTNGENEGRRDTKPFRNRPSVISSPSAKLQLLNMSRQGMMSKGWLGTGSTEKAIRKQTCDTVENYVGSDENKTIKQSTLSRGLWLKSDLQRGPKSANGSRNTSIQETNLSFDKKIISGDLLFQGKAEVDKNSKSMEDKGNASVSVTYLQSDNPLDESGVPCYLRGHIFDKKIYLPMSGCFDCKMTHRRCEITSGTVVQILHPLDVSNSREIQRNGVNENEMNPPKGGILNAILSEKRNASPHPTRGHDHQPRIPTEVMGPKSCVEIPTSLCSKLSSYDKETIESLSLQMSTMLTSTVCIGTTPRALSMRKVRHQESETMEEELDAFWDIQSDQVDHSDIGQNANPIKRQSKMSDPVPLLLREGAILVHNSHPNSGKTTLVTAIAEDILDCHAVHVVSAPALFAKYGTSADVALESMLHELALGCAVRGGAAVTEKEQPYSGKGETARVCIVLDHFETFLPLSRQSSGDPYSPVLNAMVAYLNRLSFSLKNRNEFPFPSNNPLYHVCDSGGGSSGFSLPLGICLVGVATCSDSSGKGDIFQSALDAIGGGRFRVPLPSKVTRLSAFEHTFDVSGVKMTDSAKKVLPELAAAATWASGGAFMDTARKIRVNMTSAGVSVVSEQDLKRAMTPGRGQSRAQVASYTTGASSSNTTPGSAKVIAFSSVGGNAEAKLALEDALALDPAKRHLLSKFGLQTPTGVLLYGPPGTGKTLLARAVAQSLHKKDGTEVGNSGGAFVALKASDVVRPEVGNSEKMIVSAFEAARLNAPSVLFIDEFQALFGDRDGGGFILGQLASTLLQCMDDITRWSEAGPQIDSNTAPDTSSQNSRIVVLGATNTPWMIDRAFLRPGRFDRAVHVGLPNVEDSEEILRVHVSKMRLASLAGGLSPVDEICKYMAKLCLGFSGADLAAICRAAAVRCLSSDDGATGISKKHFTDAYMHDVMRSSNDALVRKISAWQP